MAKTPEKSPLSLHPAAKDELQNRAFVVRT
jgi:hypothetical protein